MPLWLCKQEPDAYSFADLVRDGRTVWDGVSNALALKHLRQMQPGDRVLFYATGKVKAIVGEMRVESVADAVTVVPVRPFARPVTLAEVKADPALAQWELARLPRLSVMPVTQAQWGRVEELSRAES